MCYYSDNLEQAPKYDVANKEYGHVFGRKLKTSSKGQAQCKFSRLKRKLDPLSCTFTLVVIVEN